MFKINKCVFLIIMLSSIRVLLNAQDYQITFAILGNTNSPDSILVENSNSDLEVVLQNGDILYLEEATTGISENILSKQSLKVYPNPLAELASVEFYNPTAGKVSMEVYTIEGKRILSSNQDLPQGYYSYALSGLNKGMYVVHLNTPENKSTAVIISNTNTITTPKFEWEGIEQNSSAFAQSKSAKNNQSIVKMPYNQGESLKFTAYLSKFTSIEEAAVTRDTTVNFTFIPFTSFSANQTSVEIDQEISFTDDSANGATGWLWAFGDGESSTSQNPAHTYASAGTYMVTLTASNTAGDSTISKADYITVATQEVANYPSDVIPFFNEWNITMGDGSRENDLVDYEHPDFFYDANDGTRNWVVYKTPNSGGTTPNSSNTRSELRHFPEWTPETGGKLTGTLKVMHVSTSADARIPASFSVVVGQIHSSEGHENEPIKIFYKKYPGHTKGSVFWTYEINTAGDDNGGRWDYSIAIWGNDWSVVGSTADTYPAEPADGIELGEEFSYEINVYQGIMYLTFSSEGHDTRTFTKSLISSDYTTYDNIPEQVLEVFSSTGQDGTERSNAYSGELQYFKQGAYNQTNGKDPEDNMVWNTGAETYGGDLDDQYANGSYAEVWFKEATVGEGTAPINE